VGQDQYENLGKQNLNMQNMIRALKAYQLVICLFLTFVYSLLLLVIYYNVCSCFVQKKYRTKTCIIPNCADRLCPYAHVVEEVRPNIHRDFDVRFIADIWPDIEYFFSVKVCLILD
jgi:hypothetical protein